MCGVGAWGWVCAGWVCAGVGVRGVGLWWRSQRPGEVAESVQAARPSRPALQADRAPAAVPARSGYVFGDQPLPHVGPARDDLRCPVEERRRTSRVVRAPCDHVQGVSGPHSPLGLGDLGIPLSASRLSRWVCAERRGGRGEGQRFGGAPPAAGPAAARDAEESGLTLEQAAPRLDWSTSKLNRIEIGPAERRRARGQEHARPLRRRRGPLDRGDRAGPGGPAARLVAGLRRWTTSATCRWRRRPAWSATTRSPTCLACCRPPTTPARSSAAR